MRATRKSNLIARQVAHASNDAAGLSAAAPTAHITSLMTRNIAGESASRLCAPWVLNVSSCSLTWHYICKRLCSGSS